MICANQDCGIEFEAKTHNQKYHSDECCRVATNKKIMEKYYEKKAIRSGSSRLCKNCNSQLSRYNDQKICSMCQKNSNTKNKSKIIEMLDDIS
jgi:uncharacterized UPF0160 family protein